MSRPKYIYSENCRVGDVGEATIYTDCMDKKLFVGDIVAVFSYDPIIDQQTFHGLSSVVTSKYETYTDGTIKEYESYEVFIMGIKGVDFDGEDCKWHLELVKSHKDVIDGEKWEK